MSIRDLEAAIRTLDRKVLAEKDPLAVAGERANILRQEDGQ